MRRLLPILAGLVAVSCATGGQGPSHAGLASAGAVRTPAGFERQPNESVTEYDLGHHGVPDVFKYTVKDASGKEVLVRKERDLNGDGKIDTWELYGPDGSLSRVAYDLDFDGKPDDVLYFEKNQLVRKEMAFGFDGVPGASFYYEKGKLVRVERATNGDGKIDVWEYWENGELDRIGYDTDGDGQVDRWEARKTKASAAAERAQSSSAAPAAPSAAPAASEAASPKPQQ